MKGALSDAAVRMFVRPSLSLSPVTSTELATRSDISRRSSYGGYTALWQAAWCQLLCVQAYRDGLSGWYTNTTVVTVTHKTDFDLRATDWLQCVQTMNDVLAPSHPITNKIKQPPRFCLGLTHACVLTHGSLRVKAHLLNGTHYTVNVRWKLHQIVWLPVSFHACK